MLLDLSRGFPNVPEAAAASLGWRRELALRFALAILPCIVLVFYLPSVLGRAPTAWLVPLAMALANALVAVSLAREILGRRSFLAFWVAYASVWAVVAWHGFHYHGPPRPAALFMNLGEISHTPLPDRTEFPWGILGVALVLGWLARRPSPSGPRLRLATLVVVATFLALHLVTSLRYRTRDMLRFSQYVDLVRTQGLEPAAALDALELLRTPDSASILRDLRAEVAAHTPAPLPLEPVAADRVVIVQVESLDREVINADSTPALSRLWNGATHGLVDPLRTSVSGSSSADFQLLTGLRPLAAVPMYKLRWDGDPGGLPAHAASRGFAFHVYHGNDRQFWNRGPFLSAMGASFHALDAIPETEFSRWGRADGDLFRYAAASVRMEGRAVHFLITLSTHAPFDLVDPAAHLDGATSRARYVHSVAYLDRSLASFLEALPRNGTTLVVLYSDHGSNVFAPRSAQGQAGVPMILGRLGSDGSLVPLSFQGRPVLDLSEVYEIPALNRFIKDCLDASAH
jgi:phosphoglycerol transferase MdoB-like AlkP superfamily enzyme